MGPLPGALSLDTSREGILEALRTGPYGRCVYRCDNDVVDHQVVNMEFEGGITVTLFMHGHSDVEGRTMRYDGTWATLRGRSEFRKKPEISVHDHLTGEVERFVPDVSGGHGGGDEKLIAAFLRAVKGEETPRLTSATDILESHLMCFAAEESRVRGGAVIEMEQFRQQAYQSAAT